MTILRLLQECQDREWDDLVEEATGLLESARDYPESGGATSRAIKEWEAKVETKYFKHIEQISRVPDADEILAHNPGMEDE